MPYIQLETPTSRKFGEAFVKGMRFCTPFSSYHSCLYMLKRLIGIPGYQYKAVLSEQGFIRQVSSPNELMAIVNRFQMTPGHEYRRQLLFDEKMYLFEIRRKSQNQTCRINDGGINDDQIQFLVKFLNLNDASELYVSHIKENEVDMYFDDRKFRELKWYQRFQVWFEIYHMNMLKNYIAKPILEAGLTGVIMLIKSYQKIHSM
jgi:hypothetical protein